MGARSGDRFPVGMEQVFPHGFYAMGVEQAMDYDERTGRRTPSKDKVSGDHVWDVVGIDRDPQSRDKQVKVKVSAPVSPVLPGEIAPGTGLHAVEFTGITVTPYVVEGRGGGRARLAFSYRASGMHAQGKAPAAAAAVRAAGIDAKAS